MTIRHLYDSYSDHACSLKDGKKENINEGLTSLTLPVSFITKRKHTFSDPLVIT